MAEIDAQIPGALSGIVSKCLERDVSSAIPERVRHPHRPEHMEDERAAGTIRLEANVKPWGQTLPWPLIAGILTALVLAICGYMLRDRLFRAWSSTASAPVIHPVSLAIFAVSQCVRRSGSRLARSQPG